MFPQALAQKKLLVLNKDRDMKNTMFVILCLLILSAGCVVFSKSMPRSEKNGSLSAVEQESIYQCYRIKKSPVLDGKIDDTCWEFIPEAKCFFLIGGNEFAMAKPSSFKAAWDDKNFYFGFIAEEPDVQKIIAKRPDGDKFLWTEDSVELFLIPPGRDAWQFIINAIGSRWNGKGETGTTLPLGNWQAKSYIGQSIWSVEVEIPFESIGRIPSDGEKWRINIGRNNLTGPIEERVSCWPRIKKSFHETDDYGTLIFKMASLNSQTTKIQENMINLPRYNILRKRIRGLADAYKNEYRKYLEKAHSIPLFSKEADKLVKVWVSVVDYDEKMNRDGKFNLGEMYGILLKTKGLKEKTEELKQKIELESLFD